MPTKRDLHIEPLAVDQDIPYDLLELADPSRQQIEAYLKTGTCHVGKIASAIVGLVLLDRIAPAVMEIKNIAVSAAEQGRGFGKLLLRYSEAVSRASGCQRLVIGTGNSSIGQLALYQKEGFEIVSIERNFFLDNYPEPIFENGIPCKHKIVLEKCL